MDAKKAGELSLLASQQILNAKQYADARTKSGVAKSQLDILLTASLANLRKEKRNLGVEMAYLMLMESNETAKQLYREFVQEEAKYKGLEKLIDAYASKISLEQSVMKYIGQGERYNG